MFQFRWSVSLSFYQHHTVYSCGDVCFPVLVFRFVFAVLCPWKSKHTLESACGCPQKYLLQFLLGLPRISGSVQPSMLTTSHIWIMILKICLIWVPLCYKHKTYIGFEDLVPPQKYFSNIFILIYIVYIIIMISIY